MITLAFENINLTGLLYAVLDVLAPGVLCGNEPECRPCSGDYVPLHAGLKVAISPGFSLSSVVREGCDAGI